MATAVGKSIGRRIKIARVKAGLTQEQLAAQADRTPETISNLERGATLPSLESLLKLCRLLSVPVSEILDEPGTGPRRSSSRLELETRLTVAAARLSDGGLRQLIAHAGVIAESDSPPKQSRD